MEKSIQRAPLRLKTLLTLPFVALILAPAVVIALSSLYTGLKAVDELAKRVIVDVSSRAELAAVRQLEEATITLRASTLSALPRAGQGRSQFSDFAVLERMLFELTANSRTSAYMFYGNESGAFIGVDRGTPGAIGAVKIRTRGTKPMERRQVYSAAAPGDRSRLLEVESRDFDPRMRPWYKNAKAAEQLTWTPIYVSFASGSLVTTASQPVFNENGALEGVLAADVVLSDLSNFMKSVAVSESGVAFIVDREGFLVASSSPGLPFVEQGGQQIRLKAAEAKSEVERVAAQWWSEKKNAASSSGEALAGGALVSSKIGGDIVGSMDVAMRPVRGIEGVNWDIVVAIPRSDLTAPIVRSTALMFLVVVAALLAALQLGLWVVRRILRDVDGLVNAVNSYDDSTVALAPAKTSLYETSLLSDAFRAMFARLRVSLTTIRQQNEALALLNTTLEERVERRTEQLESKNLQLSGEILRREKLESELREASAASTKQADDKVRFMAMLGHELRTPLQTVIATAELVSAQNEADAAHAQTLRAASQSVLVLIDGVLSYAKLEAGRVDPVLNDFDPRIAVADALRVATGTSGGKVVVVDTHVDAGVPQMLRSDVGVFRQIITNLVANSMRHAPGGRINIDMRVADQSSIREGGKAFGDNEMILRVVVRDDGPGIPAQLRSTLFQPFQKVAHAGNDASKGSGLGLAICAMLVRTLGGDIALDESVKSGTAIAFTLRAGLAATTPAAHATTAVISTRVAAPAGALRVLVVEDHAVNARLLSQLLEIDGHSVQIAGSGEAALELLKPLSAVREQGGVGGVDERASSPFDFAFMDLNLPGIDGIETLRRLIVLHEACGARLPVCVALTASADASVRRECLAAGFARQLTKPASLELLRATIAQLQATSLVSAAVAQPQKALEAGDSESASVDFSALDRLRAVERQSPKPFVDELIRTYLVSLDAEVRGIAEAVANKDEKRVRTLAHALSGASASVGARAIVVRCRHIDADTVEQLQAEAEQTKNSYTRWLREATA